MLRGERGGVLQMPTDKCLVADAGFRPFVELYARVSRATLAISFHAPTRFLRRQGAARWRPVHP